MIKFKQKVLQSLSRYRPVKYRSIHKACDQDWDVDSVFFPTEILKKVQKMRSRHVSFVVNDTMCYLTLCSNDKENVSIRFFVDFIAKCISIMQEVFFKHVKECKIYLALTNHSKQLPDDGVITAININSGLSYIFNDDSISKIYVYRKEEICKVLIHEILHIHKIHPIHYSQLIDNQLVKKHDIRLVGQSSINIYEAYVESVAVYINTIIYEQMFNEEKVFKKEMTHQLYVINQLHDYRPYVEKTNVFAYVFLKYNILSNLEEVLSTLTNNNYCIHGPDVILKYSNNIQFNVLSSRKYYKKLRLHKFDIYLKSRQQN